MTDDKNGINHVPDDAETKRLRQETWDRYNGNNVLYVNPLPMVQRNDVTPADASPETTEANLQEAVEWRVIQQNKERLEAYQFAYRSLEMLSEHIPEDWLTEKFEREIYFEDIADKITAANALLVMNIERIQNRRKQNGPPIKPDQDGGDLDELTASFKKIFSAIKMLKKLLPPEGTADSFVARLQNNKGDGTIALPPEDDNVATKEVQGHKSQGKSTKQEGEFILSGTVEDRIREAIDALKHYAACAAPLVGITFEETQLVSAKDPDNANIDGHTIDGYKIKRYTVNPDEFGVQKSWTQGLGLKLLRDHESDTLTLQSVGKSR